MTFKEQVIKLLPTGSEFLRLFSEKDNRSKLEYSLNGQWQGAVIDNIDLTILFHLIPFLSVPSYFTYNDLYDFISNQYDLGLVKGVDYDNSQTLNVDTSHRYLELPILKDSLGYYGTIRCRITRSGNDLNGVISQRDLTTVDHIEMFKLYPIKHFLLSKVFSLPNSNLFTDVGITSDFITHLNTELAKQFPKLSTRSIEDILERGFVTGLLNDGLSDIFVFKTPIGNEFFIRFTSHYGDLPDVKFIFNSGINTLDDNSEGLLSGSSVVDLENPVENEGEFIYGIQEERSDLSIPLVTPKENILIDIGKEIEIIKEEIITQFE